MSIKGLIALLALIVIASPALAENNADAARNYMRRGAANIAEKDFSVAVMNLNMAVALAPENATAHYLRGVVFDMQGERERALGDYSSAIERAPGYAEPHLRRAMLLMKSGDTDAALAGFDMAIRHFSDAVVAEGETNTGLVRAHIGRGHAYGKTGDFKRAVRDYTSAIDMMGADASGADFLSAVLGRGTAYLESSDATRAEKDFSMALASAPDDALAHYGLARVRGRASDEAEACSHLKSALDEDSSYGLSEKALIERDFDLLRGKDCYKEALTKAEAKPQHQ